MSAETVTVPAWKLRRAAEILDRDGDEHGVAADLWAMLADAGAPSGVTSDEACRFAVWWNHKRKTFTTTRQAAWAAWADACRKPPNVRANRATPARSNDD